ncbi:Rpn family recombination-promoting nuclease/putative transposase [Candidatus Hamiltonella defensa]|nr:Rpn family recombination-promoting nuclease/putative transposase [Candidatus Hamiltonella defensa]MBK4361676.1 Rpn family recombination-promoting nuclease/putative transposase [Candidatus Hamiltonella defensa]
MALSKFLDPKNDFAFKKIFGTEKNKGILIHFLNDMLAFSGNQAITEVTFLSPVQDPDILAKKQSLVDVLCQDKNGVKYIIEMQVAKTKGFEKRAQYYAAKAYSQQADQGDHYHELKEIIFIAIADCLIFPDKPSYKSDHIILDRDSGEHDLKDFYFTFIELPKFKKAPEELTSMIEKWCYFFKHAEDTHPADLEKIIGTDSVIKQAYHELDRYYWTENELLIYEQEVKRTRDAQAIIAQKLDDARAEGIKEGKAEGREEGIKEGREEGIKEGMHKAQMAMAKKLLAHGVERNTVKLSTGLSDEDLNQLQE